MVEITSFPEVSQQDLLDLADIIAQYISEEYPDLDVTKGSAIYNLVIKPATLGYALISHQSNLTKDATTLLGKTETDDDKEVVDNILANYFIERQTGIKARGLINITLVNDLNTSILSTTVFTANDFNYFPIQDYDYTQGNNAVITIEIEAEETGAQYIVEAGTVMENNHFNIDTAIAPVKISNGSDEETNLSLLERAELTFSNRSFANKKSIERVLSEEFTGIKYIDIEGFGDVGQERDISSFGIHKGSLIDIYLRTGLEKLERTVVQTVASNQIVLISDDIPPVLKIESIQIDGADVINYTISRETKETFHVIDTAQLTGYEIITITFPDTSYNGKDANINYWTMGDIVTIQGYVDQDDIRNLNADILIRSAIPYEVDASCEYTIATQTTTLTENEVVDLISQSINLMNGGVLNINQIINDLFTSGIIVKKIILSTNHYDTDLNKITEGVTVEYKDYEDKRICFFANDIEVHQV